MPSLVVVTRRHYRRSRFDYPTITTEATDPSAENIVGPHIRLGAAGSAADFTGAEGMGSPTMNSLAHLADIGTESAASPPRGAADFLSAEDG